MNAELFLTRGFSCIAQNIALECLLFPVEWFTRSVRSSLERKTVTIQLEKDREEGKLLWLYAHEGFDERAGCLLLEQCAFEASSRGCLYLTASVDPDSPVSRCFHDFGFNAIGMEQAWQYTCQQDDRVHENPGWRRSSPGDLSMIQRLQNSTLSPAEKLVSRSVLKIPPQYILEIDGEILGYAHARSYQSSVVVSPVFSHTVDSPHKMSAALLDYFFTKYLNMYILLNSPGIWGETQTLENYELIQPIRARMVKHLAVRVASSEPILGQFSNGRNTDVIAPLSKTVGFKDKI